MRNLRHCLPPEGAEADPEVDLDPSSLGGVGDFPGEGDLNEAMMSRTMRDEVIWGFGATTLALNTPSQRQR